MIKMIKKLCRKYTKVVLIEYLLKNEKRKKMKTYLSLFIALLQ